MVRSCDFKCAVNIIYLFPTLIFNLISDQNIFWAKLKVFNKFMSFFYQSVLFFLNCSVGESKNKILINSLKSLFFEGFYVLSFTLKVGPLA